MIVGMLSAAVTGIIALFYFRKKAQNDYYAAEKPPKGAPQLDIKNPGTQDDFPTAPQTSELG